MSKKSAMTDNVWWSNWVIKEWTTDRWPQKSSQQSWIGHEWRYNNNIIRQGGTKTPTIQAISLAIAAL